MEVQGIPASNPTDVNIDNSAVGAMGNIFTSMNNYLKNIDKNVDELNEAIKSRFKVQNSTVNPSKPNDSGGIKALLSALQLNSRRLGELAATIRTTKVQIEFKGVGAPYFQQLAKLMAKDKTLIALERFSTVYESAVIKMARLEKYSRPIEKTAQSMAIAFGSFSKLGKGLMMLSAGLALLGLTLATFMELITVEDLLKFAGIILTLRLASEISEGAAKDFAKLAVAVGLLGLAVYAFNEFLDSDMTFEFIGKIVAIGGAVFGLAKVYQYVGKSKGLIANGSKNVALMAGSLWLMGKALEDVPNLDAENLIILGATIYALGNIYNYIGKFSKQILSGALGVAAVGGSLWVIAQGLNELSTINISGEKALEMIGAFAAAVTLVGLVGASGPVALAIGAGALAVAAVGGALWTLAWGLKALTTISVSKEQANNFKDSTINVVKALGEVGLYAGLIAIAVPTTAALALATGSAVASLWMVSKLPEIDPQKFENFKLGLDKMIDAYTVLAQWGTVGVMAAVPVTGALALATLQTVGAMNMVTWMPDIDPTKYDNFKYGLSRMIDVYSVLGLKSSLKIMGSVPVTGAMAMSTLAIRTAMWAISGMRILKPEQYDNFRYALEQLVSIYKDIGVWGAVKAGASASVVTIIAGASLATASAIRAFTYISKDPTAVDTAVQSVDRFITGFVNAFELNKDKIDSVAPGIKAFVGIGRMGKGIADTVRALGKMEFEDNEIDANGRMVRKGVTKITPNDLIAVGDGLGKIINALTEPLANAGSQKETYKIGKWTITNPFSNKVKKGVEAMAKIGSVITPLVDAIKLFNDPENKIDDVFVASFNKNFASMMGTIGTSFKVANAQLGPIEFKNMTEAAKTMDILTRAVSREGFDKGATVFTGVASDIGTVKNHLNGMDLEKLTKFNSMMGNLVELQKSKGMEELIKAFKEFIETFVNFTEIREREIESSENRAKEIQDLKNLSTPIQTKGSGVLAPSFQPEPVQPQTDRSLVEVVNSIEKLYKLFISTEGAKVRVTNPSPLFNNQ